MTVTKADIAEIKRAATSTKYEDSFALVADVRHVDGTNVATMTVHEIKTMPEGFDPPSVIRRHEFAVDSRIQAYRRYDARRIVASQQIYRTSITAAHSLANVLRDGDTIQTNWMIGNDTENLRNAKMTHDEVTIRVYRRGKFVVEIPFASTVTPVDGYIVGFEDRSRFS